MKYNPADKIKYKHKLNISNTGGNNSMNCEELIRGMTKNSLQKYCDKEGLKVKILFVKQTEYDDYYVIYTFDLDYNPESREYTTTDYVVEPEYDELVENEEDFAFCVKARLESKAEERGSILTKWFL